MTRVPPIRLALLGAAALIASACSDDGGGEPLTAGEATARSTEEGCAQAHECEDSYPTSPGPSFEAIFQDSPEACADFVADVLGIDPVKVQASVDAGRISYDAEDFAECLAYETASCENFWRSFDNAEGVPEACQTDLYGTVPDAGTCTIPLDCAGDGSTCTDGVCG